MNRHHAPTGGLGLFNQQSAMSIVKIYSKAKWSTDRGTQQTWFFASTRLGKEAIVAIRGPDKVFGEGFGDARLH
jgi:hypothetical protein